MQQTMNDHVDGEDYTTRTDAAFPLCVDSVVKYSMACPLLALRGWKQFETNVLRLDDTDEERLRVLFIEGFLESFPQLVLGQVRAYR